MKNVHAPVILAFLAASVLSTQASGANDSMAVTPLPPERMQGDTAYISGGVGQEEAAAMRSEAAKFPLSLEFIRQAQPNAEFVADVGVVIRDARGRTILDTISEGPILLARVPPGRYTVTADNHGQPKERTVTVAERRPEHVVFAW